MQGGLGVWEQPPESPQSTINIRIKPYCCFFHHRNLVGTITTVLTVKGCLDPKGCEDVVDALQTGLEECKPEGVLRVSAV